MYSLTNRIWFEPILQRLRDIFNRFTWLKSTSKLNVNMAMDGKV